jgi:hypothetical protein
VMEGKHIGEQFVEKRGVDRKILGIQKFIWANVKMFENAGRIPHKNTLSRNGSPGSYMS